MAAGRYTDNAGNPAPGYYIGKDGEAHKIMGAAALRADEQRRKNAPARLKFRPEVRTVTRSDGSVIKEEIDAAGEVITALEISPSGSGTPPESPPGGQYTTDWLKSQLSMEEMWPKADEALLAWVQQNLDATPEGGTVSYRQAWINAINAKPTAPTPAPGTESKSGFPGETDAQQLHRLRAALSQRRVADLRDKGVSLVPKDFETWTLAATQAWFNDPAQKGRWEADDTGIVAGLLGEGGVSTTTQPGGVSTTPQPVGAGTTGDPVIDESLKSLTLAGGIEERKLDAKIAADAAQAAYLEKRLNFETEDAARRAGLDAARLAVESRSLNRQFGLDVGNFLMQARGPRNYGQLFNIYGGDPASGSGLPRRLLNTLTGAGPVGATPNTAVPAGTQLGFGEQLRQIFGGGGQASADEVLRRLVSGPQQTAPQFGADSVTGRAGFNLDPRNLSPVQVAKLQPSEREALGSLFEAGGFPLMDVEEMLNRALPNAPRVASPRLGTVGLRT